MPWNDGLAGRALEIAASNSKRLWVAAGPGTGKTYALMRRLWRLLDVDAVQPDDIYLCTFTRTAATDLVNKIRELGVAGATRVETSTIHSFCFGLLGQEAALQQTGRVPRTLLRFEERFMKLDLKQAGNWSLRTSKKKLLALSAYWARMQPDPTGAPRSADDQRFKRDLDDWLKFHEAMLVGEIIPEANKFLSNNPLSEFRRRFKHMLVDEYQDLNKAEQEVVELLAADAIAVIGDEDQSIYSFKYAHPAGIKEFPERHQDTERKVLDECRRCPRAFVTLANSLISHNRQRQPRVMQPVPNPQHPAGEVHVVQWHNLGHETEGIAQFIHHRVRTNQVNAGKVLVLVPRGDFGIAIRDRLRQLGTDAHSFFAEEAFDPSRQDDPDTKAAKTKAAEAFSLIQLLANPQDRVALRCWCGFGSDNGNAAGWKRIFDAGLAQNKGPASILDEILAGTQTIRHTDQIVTRYRELKQRIAAIAGIEGQQLLDSVLPADEAWSAELRGLLQDTREQSDTPAQLAKAIKSAVSQPELPTEVNYVRVMSLHKSKGLTADLVVVTGCMEGLLPRTREEADGDPFSADYLLEEQRRLFYVAITRAARTLVISHVREIPYAEAKRLNIAVTNVRSRRGGARYNVPRESRFISECGPSKPATESGADFLRAQGIQ